MRTRERAALTGAENMVQALLDKAHAESGMANIPDDSHDAGTRAEARRWIGRLNKRMAEIKRALDPARSERNKRAAETRRRKREAKGGGLFVLGGASSGVRFPAPGERVDYVVTGKRGRKTISEFRSGTMGDGGTLWPDPPPVFKAAKRRRVRFPVPPSVMEALARDRPDVFALVQRRAKSGRAK